MVNTNIKANDSGDMGGARNIEVSLVYLKLTLEIYWVQT